MVWFILVGIHIVVLPSISMAKSRQSLMKTACGHRVKSKAEKRIDDWLHRNGWISIYEPEIKFCKTKTQPDWVLLPQHGITKPVIVEYWGLSVLRPNASYWAQEAQPKYQEKRKFKESLYLGDENYHYIGLELPDLKQLDEVLGEALNRLKEC